jgi:hypothetical protein
MADSLYNALLSEGIVEGDAKPTSDEVAAIETRAAKDAESVVGGKIASPTKTPNAEPVTPAEEVKKPRKKKPVEDEAADEEEEEVPKPKPKPKKKPVPKKRPAEEEEDDLDLDEAAKPKKKPKLQPKKPVPVKKAAKKADVEVPPKKTAPKKAPPKKPVEDADEDADESPEPSQIRHSPGYSLLRVERDRIERALVSLRNKNEHRATNTASNGKRPTTTVCSILNDALIEFYEEVQGKFMARFKRYLEESS